MSLLDLAILYLVVGLACAAEYAGFTLVTVMDHFYQIRGVGPETEPMLECHTTLAALAQRTNRVRLAALVAGVTYRNPAILAKTGLHDRTQAALHSVRHGLAGE